MSEKLLPPPCPAGGSIVEAVEQAGGSENESGECFSDDDFICPACCCGVYIEVKE